MALKIFTIILALFIAELTFLATKEPKNLKHKKEDLFSANLEFEKLKGSTITLDGITNSLKASKAIKYDNKEELYKIDLTYKDTNLTHTIKAEKAIHKDDKLIFKKNIFYENNQSMQIKTENLEYNLKDKVISSKEPFIMSRDDSRLRGDSFVYDMKNRALKAKEIDYTQEVDER